MFQVCQPPALPNYTTAECAGVFQSVILRASTSVNFCGFTYLRFNFFIRTQVGHINGLLYTRVNSLNLTTVVIVKASE